MLDWLTDIDRGDKIVPDLVIYIFSLISFAILPVHFGRKIWWFLGAFLFLNVAFLLGFWNFLDWEKPILFTALGQLPWFLFVLDLVFRGRLSGKVEAVPLREFILWQITRIMGIHFVLAVYGGYAPEEFAVEVGFSELLTGLGALVLWFFYRPDRGWYRTVLIFWNTYGLTSVLAANYRIFLSNPHFPFHHYSREIFAYMTAYPQNWVYCFWFPTAICMHAAIFYKLYHKKPGVAAPKPI